MIYCALMGGLGNQLFQIFATIAYGLQHGQPFAFPKKDYLIRVDRPTYWQSFLVKLQPYLVEKLPDISFSENGFEYNAFPLVECNFPMCIEGYFQSELYFKPHFSEICEMIGLGQFQTECLLKYPDYNNMISMHFRIGDYANITDCHPIMPIQYYKNALQHILSVSEQTHDVLYFCEEKDNECALQMISQLQSELQFSHVKFHKAPEVAAWEQMIMMSICKHHIIANSTFSWWGAYFHRNLQNVGVCSDQYVNSCQYVCYPDKWFGHLLSHKNIKDLHPKEWTVITL